MPRCLQDAGENRRRQRARVHGKAVHLRLAAHPQAAPKAITTDCKEYAEGGVRFSVAQIEEIGFDQFWKRKDELLEALREYQRPHGYLFSALLVTDVTPQSSLLLVAGRRGFVDGLIIRKSSRAFTNCGRWCRARSNCCRI